MAVKIRTKIIITLLMISSFVVVPGAYAWKERRRADFLEMNTFLVKGGMVSLVRTGQDQRIIIDGGANSEIVSHISKMVPFYSRRVDKIIITEPIGNKVSGLIDTIQRYDVQHIYVPALTLDSIDLASTSDPAYQLFLDQVRNMGINITYLKKGDNVIIDSKTKISIYFPVDLDNFEYSKASPPQLIMKIESGKHSILFLGNATKKIQKYLIDEIGSTDILLTANSAGEGSLDSEFVINLRPKYLVYSKNQISVTKIPKSSSKSKIQNKSDPVFMVTQEKRFNLKIAKTVRIISDGNSLNIE